MCFGYLLESPHWGDSIKYSKHAFYEQKRTKQDLSYISIFSLRIFYNRKFILMATFLGTNAVVVTRVHCILFIQHVFLYKWSIFFGTCLAWQLVSCYCFIYHNLHIAQGQIIVYTQEFCIVFVCDSFLPPEAQKFKSKLVKVKICCRCFLHVAPANVFGSSDHDINSANIFRSWHKNLHNF